jgi:hypothetical protein
MNHAKITERVGVASNWLRIYESISLSLSLIFGVVGLLFLFLPESVLIFFNNISSSTVFQESPVHGASLYLLLAVGYMYIVSLLAFSMYRYPENKVFPFLLVNAKSASSILSLLFFVFQSPYLIFLANGVIDGFIAVGVFVLSRKTMGVLK